MSLEREGPDDSARTSGGGGLRGGEQGGGAAAEQVMGDNWIVGSRGRDEESPARAYATRLDSFWLHQFRFFLRSGSNGQSKREKLWYLCPSFRRRHCNTLPEHEAPSYSNPGLGVGDDVCSQAPRHFKNFGRRYEQRRPQGADLLGRLLLHASF